MFVIITTWGSNASSNSASTCVAPVFTTTGTAKLVPDCTGPAGETIRAVPGSTSTGSGSTVQSKEVLVVATPSDTVTVTLYGLPVAAPFAIVPLINAGWRDDVDTQPWRQVGGVEAERATVDIARDDIERHCCPSCEV